MQHILAVCGWKNSGKTTLIEKLIPRLTAEGLSVAVIKHDVHGIEIDREGKDSDRFFRAGADVFLQGPGEDALRRHRSEETALDGLLADAFPLYDVVLVEGHKGTNLPKIWLNRDDRAPPPEQSGTILLELSFAENRVDVVTELLKGRLNGGITAQAPWGVLLIGGRSRRMGAPKHLIEIDGETWIERAIRELGRVAQNVVVAGAGELPEKVGGFTRLPDAVDAQGPMSGLLAAMRWNPSASWLVAACDMPDLSTGALEWILSERRPGAWAVMPRLPDEAVKVQPLLAFYDFRARSLVEACARSGDFSLFSLTAGSKVLTPCPPREIMKAWRNINNPEELQQYRMSLGKNE
jgi:molybdenum cofactor guanylyltransferase